MKIIATIECRLNSKRLPNKLILPLGKLTIIEFLIQRLKKVTIKEILKTFYQVCTQILIILHH